MIPFFLASRLTRIGRRPVADASIKASIRESLVRAGYLPERSLFLVRFRMVAASAALLLTGFGGMASYAYAADAVLPNTLLYPVRQKMEALERRLAPTPLVRARVFEKQLQRRKKEAHLLESFQKQLPPLHARLLKEEREEGRAVYASSTTRIAPLSDPKEERQAASKDRVDRNAPGDSQRDRSKKDRPRQKEKKSEKRPRDRS